MLSKREILQLAPAEEIVEIEGGKVKMRGLSAREYGDYERSLLDQQPDGSFRPKNIDGGYRANLVARCLTDEAGETFTAEEVGTLDASIVSHLFDVARRLCGVSETDTKELAATFGQAQGDGNSSE
jgi:ABC-type phosphonate transport system ATPase subunit